MCKTQRETKAMQSFNSCSCCVQLPHCSDGRSCWDSWSSNQLCCSTPSHLELKSPVRPWGRPRPCPEGPAGTCRPIWVAEQGGTHPAPQQASYRLLGGGRSRTPGFQDQTVFFRHPWAPVTGWSLLLTGRAPERTLETGCTGSSGSQS